MWLKYFNRWNQEVSDQVLLAFPHSGLKNKAAKSVFSQLLLHYVSILYFNLHSCIYLLYKKDFFPQIQSVNDHIINEAAVASNSKL